MLKYIRSSKSPLSIPGPAHVKVWGESIVVMTRIAPGRVCAWETGGNPGRSGGNCVGPGGNWRCPSSGVPVDDVSQRRWGAQGRAAPWTRGEGSTQLKRRSFTVYILFNRVIHGESTKGFTYTFWTEDIPRDRYRWSKGPIPYPSGPSGPGIRTSPKNWFGNPADKVFGVFVIIQIRFKYRLLFFFWLLFILLDALLLTFLLSFNKKACFGGGRWARNSNFEFRGLRRF